MGIIYEQLNSGNRYSASNAQVLQAYALSFDKNTVYVASVAEGFDPLLNYYGKPTTGSGCD